MPASRTDSKRSGRGLSTRGVAALVALAVASGSLGSTTLAYAQGTAAAPSDADKKKAGAFFKKGKELFDKKDYKGAKDQFSKAEEIVPAGTAEYYLGRCAEELGDQNAAAGWYDKSIATGKLKPDLESDAKARVATIKSKPVKIKVNSDPAGATIWIDGKDSGQKTPAEIEVTPGPHKVSLQMAGKKNNDQDVEVAAFTGANVDGKLDEAGPAVAADDPFAKKPDTTTTTNDSSMTTSTTTTATTTSEGGKRDMTWVYITGAGAIVALGVGTAFGLKALSDKKDYDANPTRDTRDKGTRDALIADMGFGIGITLAVTSAVLYFSSPSSSETASAKPEAPKMAFAPVVGGASKGAPSMAGFAAAFTF
ncbi:MAG: PEGA domain-containing protein [Polyangiales bacterium]